jgi:hypothetical protein
MSALGQQRLVDKLLAHIERNGNDERLRELAAGIRSGHAGWAESLNASFYVEALHPGLNDFAGWYDQLDESERAEHAERCQQEVDDLNREQPPGRDA